MNEPVLRNRVKAAIAHKESDIVPHHIGFTGPQYERMQAYYNNPDFFCLAENHITAAGCDNVFTPAKEGYVTDIFGVEWCRTRDADIGVVTNTVITEPDEKQICLPSVNEKLLRERYAALEKEPDKFRVGSIGFSMFERAWTLCGMENVLTYMLTDKPFVEALLDRILERNLQIVAIAAQYELDGFQFGDDWGQQKGLIMGLPLWRELILPRQKQMYAAVKKAGMKVIQHSCGDIESAFGDLIDAGLDVYQTFQPEIYDIAAVKRTYGSDLTFWGGISTQRIMAHGTPGEVRGEIEKTLEIMRKGGGYILSPTHVVECGVPCENADAFMRLALQRPVGQDYFFK